MNLGVFNFKFTKNIKFQREGEVQYTQLLCDDVIIVVNSMKISIKWFKLNMRLDMYIIEAIKNI